MEASTVGIDLGTTFSCVAVFKNGKATVIPLEDGSNTMASVVSFDEIEGRNIGDKAKIDSIFNPTNTILGVKRYIGCRYDDVQDSIDTYLYNIIDVNGQPKIAISRNGSENTFTPEEISAMILEKLKDCATNYLNKPVTKAVITVPAHFKDSQRQATQDAGKIAGLDVLRLINEPTAAALAYGIDKKYKSDNTARHIVVYDFGGGTIDVSILSYDRGILEVKSTNGDNNLGGDDIDSILLNYFSREFEDKYGLDITNEPRALRRLRMQCERVKKELSSATTANIDIADLYQSHDFYASITREKLEELCDSLFRMTMDCLDDCLQQSGLQKNDIDDILLVGGTTRMPKIRNMLQEFFNGKNIDTSLNPMEAVALGAAVQAAILDGCDSEVTGVLLLLDVAPLSLGVETVGGVMSVIVPRNTQIPFIQTKRYSNQKDNQTRVKIIVYEGERVLTEDNNKLGEFMLSGVKPKPRGQSELFVTFEVDTNGVLSVTAKELTDAGNNTLTVEIEKGRLPEIEIANMIKKAQEMNEEDGKKKVIILAKTNLKNYCIDHIKQANTIVRDEQEKATVLEKCQTTLKWLKETTAESKEEFYSKRKDLQASLMPIIKKYA